MVGLAWLVPDAGTAIRHERWLLSLLIAVILFISGLLMDLGAVARQALNLRALLLALAVTYGLGPLIGLGLAELLAPEAAGPEVEGQFREAVVLAAAQASTLAASIVLTRLAGGVGELALVLALFSNLAAVLFTPLALRLSLGVSVSFSVLDMMARIGLVIVVPVILGQLTGRELRRRNRKPWRALAPVPQALILVFAFVGFASAVPSFESGGTLVVRFVAAAVSLHLALGIVALVCSQLVRLRRDESIAVYYNACQKTVPSGIYLWETYFAANPLGAVPLVCLQLTQLLLGYLVAPVLERWRGKEPETSSG